MLSDSNTEMEANGNFRAAKKKKLYEDIVDQIQAQIDSGKLKSGDKLPSERELSEIFGVSRNTVREAIKSLEQNHTLKSVPGSGTFIFLKSSKHWIDLLAMSLFEETNTLLNVFEFRKMLEPQVARLAAENATSQEISELEEIIHKQEETLIAENYDSSLIISLDNKFHQIIAKASNNKVIFEVVKRINDLLSHSREEGFQSKLRIEMSIEGHRKIFEAIKTKNFELASVETHNHLSSVEQIVLTNLHPDNKSSDGNEGEGQD